ncbi:MAG: hypothetical protein U1D29_10295, partial [Burkholderiales bacterium]|nr:hypothetical protein [Burkholderiales bacterium]
GLPSGKTGSMSCQQVPTAPAFNPYPRSVQVGEFEVAIDGGIWVAIREGPLTIKVIDGQNTVEQHGASAPMKRTPRGPDILMASLPTGNGIRDQQQAIGHAS